MILKVFGHVTEDVACVHLSWVMRDMPNGKYWMTRDCATVWQSEKPKWAHTVGNWVHIR